MAASKSSLSAGEIIRSILTSDAVVSAITTHVFPVIVDKAELPYIVYRRAQLSQDPTKAGHGSDTVGIEVSCYTEDYTPGVELAEAVRAALDHSSASSGSLVMRSCYLSDSEEGWSDDAYIQQLVFTIKI